MKHSLHHPVSREEKEKEDQRLEILYCEGSMCLAASDMHMKSRLLEPKGFSICWTLSLPFLPEMIS